MIEIFDERGRCLRVPQGWEFSLADGTLRSGDRVIELPPGLAYGRLTQEEFDCIESQLADAEK